MVLTGPDVSHWQGKVDWAKVAVRHHFAWFKATQGVRSVDARFENNRAGVRRTGMVPGAYHFLDAEWEPRAQARHFVEVLGDLKGIMTALDVETEGGSNPTLDQVTTFVGEFKALAPGHPLVIYTSYGWWSARDHTGRGARLSPHLWHARYRSIESGYGDTYGGWPRPTFWQHTSTGSCPGISGGCDMNIFYGERDALLALAAVTGTTTAPQEDMFMAALTEAEQKELLRNSRDIGTVKFLVGLLWDLSTPNGFRYVDPTTGELVAKDTPGAKPVTDVWRWAREAAIQAREEPDQHAAIEELVEQLRDLHVPSEPD